MRLNFLLAIFVACVFINTASAKSDKTLPEKERAQQAAAPGEEKSFIGWDFGRVLRGTVVRHDFYFTNNFSKKINILNVDTSCGCAVSEVTKKELGVGESTVIKVKFDTHGYLGPVKQYVYVHTDDPANPVIRFSITAEVVK